MSVKKIARGGFSHLKDEEFLVRAKSILQAMTGSPYFPSAGGQLSDLELTLLDYDEKLAICKRKGSAEDTANKNAVRAVLARTLQRLAALVNTIANGDLQKLLSSGFELSANPKSRDFPGTIQGVVLKPGRQKGQMRLDFEKIKDALMYEFRYAPADGEVPGEWSELFATTSSRGNILAPLQPFTTYFVQVRGVNAFGRSEWSENKALFIQ